MNTQLQALAQQGQSVRPDHINRRLIDADGPQAVDDKRPELAPATD